MCAHFNHVSPLCEIHSYTQDRFYDTRLKPSSNFHPPISSYLHRFQQFLYSISLVRSALPLCKSMKTIIDRDIVYVYIYIYTYKFFFRFDTHSSPFLRQRPCNIPRVGEEANKKYDFDARQAEEIWHLWCPVENRNPCIMGLSLRMANIYYRTSARFWHEIREYRLRRLHSRLPVFGSPLSYISMKRCQRNLPRIQVL